MTEFFKPVFIIGGSRTGSEMLKTMLSASDEVDFVDELFLLCPRWLHRDLDRNIQEYVGTLSDSGAIDRLMKLLYSGVPFGWFFSVAVQRLNARLLREELLKDELSLKSVFRSIMIVHSKMNGKSGWGAKFPVHYSYVDRLLEWFPDCRLIHTTRNPKATYASQAAKYVRDEETFASGMLMRFKQFVHINIQISWTAHVHAELQALPNYLLVRYEDVVTRPDAKLREICDFMEIKLIPEMFSPNQYGSSFDSIGEKRGVDDSSLDRWRSTIHPVTAGAIDFLHPIARRRFRYGSSSAHT